MVSNTVETITTQNIREREARLLSYSADLLLLGLAIVASIYFLALTFTKQPLPIGNLRAAGTFTWVYALFCTLVVWRLCRFKVFAFPSVYMGIMFCYTLGAFFVVTLEDVDLLWETARIPNNYYHLALPVVALTYSMMIVGVTIGKMRDNGGRAISPEQLEAAWSSNQTKVVRQIATVIYTACILLNAYYVARGTGLAVAFQYGYANRGGTGFADLSAISGGFPIGVVPSLLWFLPWSSMIMLATAKTRRYLYVCTALTIFTSILTLLTGQRSVFVSMLLMMMTTLYVRGVRIRLPVLAVFVLTIMFIILTYAGIRTTPVSEWSFDLVVETTQESFEGNVTKTEQGFVVGNQYKYPFSTALMQMGQSYRTLAGTVFLVPEREPYRMGTDYIRPVFMPIPFIGTRTVDALLSTVQPTFWMSDFILGEDTNQGTGYIAIAEAYLQGGAIGVALFSLLMGFVLFRWWSLINRYPTPRMLAFTLLTMGAIYVWVRNDATLLGRPTGWAIILIFLLPSMILRPLGKDGE